MSTTGLINISMYNQSTSENRQLSLMEQRKDVSKERDAKVILIKTNKVREKDRVSILLSKEGLPKETGAAISLSNLCFLNIINPIILLSQCLSLKTFRICKMFSHYTEPPALL